MSAPVPRPAGPFVAAGSVRIFDTTLRDGEQAPGAGLTAAEKLDVARQLARLKVDVIEAGFPAASPGDFEAVRRIAQETRGGIAVAALARCKDGDPQRAIEAIRVAERPHLHVFIATSDIHLKHKLRIDRATALSEAVRWVRFGREQLGRDAEIEFSAEDASRTDLDYLLEIYAAVVEAGASTVNIPDTVGYAIPSEFGALVERVVGLVGDAGHGQRPLPQRPRSRDGQHAGRGPGRCAPGRGDDQRAGRAGRQRVARGGRHGPPDAPDPVPRARLGRRHRAADRRQPAGELPDRLRHPAQQGDRRRQRVRPRIGHPPGRRHQEPADLRDHDPAVGRPVGQPADDRQAVGPARPPGQAPGARLRDGGRGPRRHLPPGGRAGRRQEGGHRRGPPCPARATLVRGARPRWRSRAGA